MFTAAKMNSHNKPTLSPLFKKSTGSRGDPTLRGKSPGRLSRAELRVKRDVEELSSSRYCVGRTVTRVNFPGGTSNLKRCEITICPREGAYDGAVITFELEIPERYPFVPPKCTCHSRVFHPNIDWRNGEVSLGLLSRSVWQPVLTINSILFQLQTLFISPGSDLDNAINRDAKSLFLSDKFGRAFDQFVRRSVKGGVFFGVKWNAVIADAQSPALPTRPGFTRALSGGEAPPNVQGHGGPRRTRGKRLREPDTASLPQNSMQPKGQNPSPNNQRPKRQRDRSDLDREEKVPDRAGIPDSATKRTRIANNSIFGVPSQASPAPPSTHQPHSPQASNPKTPQLNAFQQSDLFDHEGHRAFLQQQQRMADMQLHRSTIGSGAQATSKRARRGLGPLPEHHQLNAELSAADRDFFHRGVQETKRSPVAPHHVFGTPLNQTRPQSASSHSDFQHSHTHPAHVHAATNPNPSLPNWPSNAFSHALSLPHSSPPPTRSHHSSSHSHSLSSSRSPAQRSSFVPMLNSPELKLPAQPLIHSHNVHAHAAHTRPFSAGHVSVMHSTQPESHTMSFGGSSLANRKHSKLGVIGRTNSSTMMDESDDENNGPCN